MTTTNPHIPTCYEAAARTRKAAKLCTVARECKISSGLLERAEPAAWDHLARLADVAIPSPTTRAETISMVRGAERAAAEIQPVLEQLAARGGAR